MPNTAKPSNELKGIKNTPNKKSDKTILLSLIAIFILVH
jgi:hypothetical protein